VTFDNKNTIIVHSHWLASKVEKVGNQLKGDENINHKITLKLFKKSPKTLFFHHLKLSWLRRKINNEFGELSRF